MTKRSVMAVILTLALMLGTAVSPADVYGTESDAAGSENAASESGEVVELPLEDQVISKGGFPDTPSEDSILKEPTEAEEKVIAQVSDTIETAIEDQQESVDLSAYELSQEDVTDIMAEVMNENPAFFYLDRAQAVVEPEEYVSEVTMQYLAPQTQSSYEAAVQRILGGIHQNWTTEQKLLYFLRVRSCPFILL